jgi:imidazoleglycerol-phosphate dehydratase
MNAKRVGRAERRTKETSIALEWCLDGSGTYEIRTGIGFFDHMLSLFAKHGFFDLKIACEGDLGVDDHHTVEDVGICLGQALDQALGDRSGIARYGSSYVPMGEALARAVVDLSGRSYLVFQAGGMLPKVGNYDTELTREFFQSVAEHGKLNVHLDLLRGSNTHHCLEALFKAAGRALDEATALREGLKGVLSTKGTL